MTKTHNAKTILEERVIYFPRKVTHLLCLIWKSKAIRERQAVAHCPWTVLLISTFYPANHAIRCQMYVIYTHVETKSEFITSYVGDQISTVTTYESTFKCWYCKN